MTTSVLIVGNLTREPELKFANNGMAIVRFTLAVTKKTEGKEDKTSFFDVSAFGSLAQNVADTLHKGTRAIVTGRLEQSTWETDKGEKRSRVELLADAVGPELRFNTAVINQSVGKAPEKTEEYSW